MAAFRANVITILFVLSTIAAATQHVPRGYQNNVVQHYGDIPAPTTCFNQGPGQLHPWMDLLADSFCEKINKYKFNKWELEYLNTDNNTVTAYWSADGYVGSYLWSEFSGMWQSSPPNSALLQVGMSPDRVDALTLHTAECKQAFGIIINGCNTAGAGGKQGGQLMLKDTMWGTDELYYIFDPNYQGEPPNEYYGVVKSIVDIEDLVYEIGINDGGEKGCC